MDILLLVGLGLLLIAYLIIAYFLSSIFLNKQDKSSSQQKDNHVEKAVQEENIAVENEEDNLLSSLARRTAFLHSVSQLLK